MTGVLKDQFVVKIATTKLNSEEIAEILKNLSQRIENGSTCGIIRDKQGNTVGSFNMG